MKEQWRDVVGYEGLYQVSNLGHVKSLDRVVVDKNGRYIPWEGRVLSHSKCKVKNRVISLNVTFCKDGIRTTFLVHRLVLEAWVRQCPTGYECCHNDGDPTNNVVSNLRWDTRKNNALDAVRHGTSCICSPRSVIRSDGVKFDSITEAARQSDCHRQSIGRACRGDYKSMVATVGNI